MKFVIDTKRRILSIQERNALKEIPLYSREAFEIISQEWLKICWNEKYTYTFTWLGRPVIQLPEDLIRVQEVIYRLRPDVIVETGVAHGGSLIFFASLCRLMGCGRVIGIDIAIRPHNRRAIESHELSSLITLIEGDSIDPGTVESVKKEITSNERAIVFLDSFHGKEHVFKELQAYNSLVSPGSYIVATDGIIRDLKDTPRGCMYLSNGNPVEAVNEFLACHPEFILEQPDWLFNESNLRKNVTHWPDAWLKRK